MKYAQGTNVPVETTQAQIRGLLATHGATAFAYAEGTGPDGQERAAMQFVLGGLPYKFEIRRPTAASFEAEYLAKRKPGMRYRLDHKSRADAEWRRLWRARLLWLKATLEFASGEGPEEVQRVLLPLLVLPDRETTMFEHAQRVLPSAYGAGKMPLLTGGDS